MSEDPVNQFAAVSSYLVALDRAGVGLDPEVTGERLSSAMTAINRALLTGTPLETALREHSPGPTYGRIVSNWLAGGELSQLLESTRATTLHEQTRRQRLTGRLAYPVLVAVLACVGLGWMLHTVLPLVESAHADLHQPVRTGVAWLQTLRSAAPIWLWAVPVLLLAGLYGIQRLRPIRLTRASREVGSHARSRLASTCDAAATLLDAGVEPVSALRLANTPQAVPPLLSWAREAAPKRTADAEDFRAIAGTYRDLAARGAERSTKLAPVLACVLIGGGATLLYGLALFVPVVELLWALNG